jgi:hypothetical protein
MHWHLREYRIALGTRSIMPLSLVEMAEKFLFASSRHWRIVIQPSWSASRLARNTVELGGILLVRQKSCIRYRAAIKLAGTRQSCWQGFTRHRDHAADDCRWQALLSVASIFD